MTAPSAPVRVAIIGAGGVGGFVGAHLSSVANVHVTMCVRRRFEVLRLDNGSETVEVPVTVATEPEEVPGADWVLLATKAYDAPAAAPWLRRLAGADVPVAVLQNGVDHEDRVRPFVKGPVLPVVVRFGAQAVAPGHIRHTGEGNMAVPCTPVGSDFQGLCARAGLEVDLDADFVTTIWNKFAYNITGNTLTTILDEPVNRIPRFEAMGPLVSHLVDECAQVGAAEGAHMDKELARKALDLFATYTDATLSSMHQDRRRSRPLEYEALTGALVRLADRHGIAVPHNETIYALLQAIDGCRDDSVPVDWGTAEEKHDD